MLAFFTSKLAVYLLIGAVALGAIWFVIHTINSLEQQVATLTVQASSLDAANAAMKDQIADDVAAQASANVALANAREQATLNGQSMANASTSAQVNKQWSDMFQRLENLAHAP
jgi:hypothetical protein